MPDEPQPIVWRNVYSSHVRAIGYDAQNTELLVDWDSGKTSAYGPGVPFELFDQCSNSTSVGSFLHAHVKGKFPHRYI